MSSNYTALTTLVPTSTRIIHHADALVWLKGQGVLPGCSFVTSLPDYSEFSHLSLTEWKTWFVNAAKLVLMSCPDDGLALFFQTDIKVEGAWVDKSFLCQQAAEMLGCELIAHKIICRSPPGIITHGRPAYSHLVCFSKKIRLSLSKSSPDVLPLAGKTTWTRGMGVNACRLACEMILQSTETRTVVDPFCGHGTVLAVANEMGMNAIGVELSRKRVEKAQNLTLEKLV